MRNLIAPFFASALLVGTARAQDPIMPGACTAPGEPPIEVLQALARQYHPEAFRPDKGRGAVTVVLVLDSHCRVLHHATRQGSAENLTVSEIVVSLFPSLRDQPYARGGIGPATMDNQPVDAKPLVAWVILL